MAVTVDISTTMTTLWTAETTTGWTGISTSTFSGFQREGTYCLGINVSNTTVNGYYTVTSFNAQTNKIFIWMLPRGQMDTLANGGVRIVVGDGTNRMAYYVGGSNYSTPFNVNGWYCYMLDVNNLPSGKDTLAGSEASMVWTAITQVGVGFKTLAKSLGGVENCFFDIGRRGTGLIVKGGTSGDPGTWAQIAADDASTASGKAYGIVMEYQSGVYGVQGQITIGDTGTADSYFQSESDTVIFMDTGAGSSFYQLNVVGNSTGTNSFVDGVIVGSGDTARGRAGSTIQSAGPQLTVNFSNANINTLNLYGTKISGATGGVTFSSSTSHVAYGATFTKSAQVSTGGLVMRNCVFSETSSTVGSLLWSSTINIKNSNFIANTTGASIQHTSATGSPFSYDNLQFSGNTYDVNNSSGSAISIYKNNGSNPSTYTGSTVTFLGAAVTTLIHVTDIITGLDMENARVLLWVTDGTNFPYNDSVSITSSGTTATVTHTAHGLATNDNVIILGATQEAYNGAYQITVTGVDTYTYTMIESTTSPATGTITATFAFINGLTDANGEISDSRIVGTDQDIIGRVRKSTSSPYYQTSPIVGTVDSVAGLNLTIQMIPDE